MERTHVYLHMGKQDLVRHIQWKDLIQIIYLSRRRENHLRSQESYQGQLYSFKMKCKDICDNLDKKLSQKFQLSRYIVKIFEIFYGTLLEAMTKANKDTLTSRPQALKSKPSAKLGSKSTLLKNFFNKQKSHQKEESLKTTGSTLTHQEATMFSKSESIHLINLESLARVF